jgi:kynureninase
VLVTDSTTVNLYRLASAALAGRPDRPVIVAHGGDFPTDRYVLQGIAADAPSRELRLLERIDVGHVRRACASGDVGLVCLSQVDFRTGAVADVRAITAAAHDSGALVLWDLSHAAGAVPVQLDQDGVDLAVGCTYKYLNAGPGAPAWLYVRAELQQLLRPPVWGWFAQEDQFAMGPAFCPAPGIVGWSTGTPNVAGLVSVDEGVALLAEAGMAAVRAKSEALTALAVGLYDGWLEPLGFGLATPREPLQRGAHVALRHPEAWRLCRVLAEQRSVIADFRPPDLLRLGLSPLTTSFSEAWDGVDRLRRGFLDGLHLAVDPTPARVT